MTNPYDDPDQQPVRRYSIAHNDDESRRVMIEIFRNPVSAYEIFADGKREENAGGPCETLHVADFVVRQLWGDRVWDLRREE